MNPVTAEALRQGWRDFRSAWKPATGLLLFFALLDFAALSPLISWGLEAIVRSAGAVAITNADLAAFALSPSGIAFLFTAATVQLATFKMQTGGLTLLAAEVVAERGPNFWDTVWRNTNRLPAFLKLSLLQTLIGLVIAAVFVGLLAGLYGCFLRGHDVNYYLSERPPEWRRALVLATGLGVGFAFVALWLVARWVFAVPLLLLDGLGPLEALRVSWRETRVNWPSLVRVFSLWWAGLAILSAVLTTLGWFLAGPLFDWAGYVPGRVLPVVAVVLVTAWITVTGIAVLGLGIHQFAITRLSLPHPARPWDPSPSLLPWAVSRRLVGLAWSGLLVILAVSEAAAWLELREMDLVESVEVTAHRGSSARAPENTLSAVRQAVVDNADFAEIDVQTTADGALVVFHDGDLMRMAGDRRRLRDLPLAQAKEVDVGTRFDGKFAGERIPTLAEVIQIARGKIRLNIELKYNWPDPTLAGKVVALLREEDLITDCIITSLDTTALAEVRRLAPELKLGQIVAASVGNVNRLSTEILSVNRRTANRRFIQQARKAGKGVHVWTLNQAGDMLLMTERGAHNLITDHPDVAVQLLRQRAELSDAEKLALRLRVLFLREDAISRGADSSTPESP